MLATFIALLAAHVVADFVLQFDWIIERKRRLEVFVLHILIVAGTAAIALGLWPGNLTQALGAIAVVGLAHVILDAIKTWGEAPGWLQGAHGFGFQAFCLDQLGHVASIVAAAWLFPDVFADGFWTAPGLGAETAAPAGFALFAGFIVATRAGQFATTAFMVRFPIPETKDAADPDQGLLNGGTWIGLLERGLTFALVLAGRFEAIGFLLAAKSVLRFSYAAKDRSHSEYVIIGTLFSFSWALATAALTVLLIRAL